MSQPPRPRLVESRPEADLRSPSRVLSGAVSAATCGAVLLVVAYVVSALADVFPHYTLSALALRSIAVLLFVSTFAAWALYRRRRPGRFQSAVLLAVPIAALLLLAPAGMTDPVIGLTALAAAVFGAWAGVRLSRAWRIAAVVCAGCAGVGIGVLVALLALASLVSWVAPQMDTVYTDYPDAVSPSGRLIASAYLSTPGAWGSMSTSVDVAPKGLHLIEQSWLIEDQGPPEWIDEHHLRIGHTVLEVGTPPVSEK
jgi:hypothetical protein